MEAIRQLKIAKNGYIIMSLLFVILGICLIIWPDCSLKLFCTLIGIMLIAYGCIKIVGYFSKDYYCLAFQFDLAFGILLIAVGAIIIARREQVVNLIFAIFGILTLADALFKIQMSMDAKRFGLSLWWRILVVAVLTGILGVLLLIRPFDAAEIMMILVGVSFLFEGILNLCVAIYTIKILENRRPDIIDMDDFEKRGQQQIIHDKKQMIFRKGRAYLRINRFI